MIHKNDPLTPSPKVHSPILFLLIFMAITMLTGCGAHGRLYSKSKVLKYMENEVEQEKYSLKSVEKVPDADVSTEIFTFQSEERDLEFVAENTRSSVFMDSAIYGRTIIPKYVEAVCEYYQEDIENIFESSDFLIDGRRIYVESYEDLVRLVDYFAAADDVYKDELNYNSAEWLIDNPYETYNLFVARTDSINVNFGSIAINGTWDSDKLLDYASFCYASAIKEGRLEEEVIPQKYRDIAHISTLHHIYLNGEDLSTKAHDTAKKKKLYNNSDSMYYSGYCYKLEDYVVPINVGLTDDKYAPQMMEEVFDRLDADYDIQYGKGVVSWEYNNEKWEIKARESGNDIQSVVFKKAGMEVDIPYVICGEWTSPISGTYVVGIRATDFANIFGLKMQVDEYGDCIKFEK